MAQYQRKLSKGDMWWYKFDHSGKTYYSKAIYDTKKLAREAETIRYGEVTIKVKNPSQKAEFSLLEAMTSRLAELEGKKSAKYVKTTQAHFTKFIRFTDDVDIATITKLQVKEFLLKVAGDLKERNKDNYTANAMMRSLKALFYYAIDTLEVDMKNPCKKIGEFSVNTKLKYIPPEANIQDLMALCSSEQKMLLEFVDETGCRINEALKLTGSDITETFIILYTRKSKNSNLVPRTLPIPQCLKGKKYIGDERIFPYWTEQPKFLSKKIKKLKQTSWGFHNLRHRRASLWNKQKETAFDIMLKLGHNSLKTTQRYLQKLP